MRFLGYQVSLYTFKYIFVFFYFFLKNFVYKRKRLKLFFWGRLIILSFKNDDDRSSNLEWFLEARVTQTPFRSLTNGQRAACQAPNLPNFKAYWLSLPSYVNPLSTGSSGGRQYLGSQLTNKSISIFTPLSYFVLHEIFLRKKIKNFEKKLKKFKINCSGNFSQKFFLSFIYFLEIFKFFFDIIL